MGEMKPKKLGRVSGLIEEFYECCVEGLNRLPFSDNLSTDTVYRSTFFPYPITYLQHALPTDAWVETKAILLKDTLDAQDEDELERWVGKCGGYSADAAGNLYNKVRGYLESGPNDFVNSRGEVNIPKFVEMIKAEMTGWEWNDCLQFSAIISDDLADAYPAVNNADALFNALTKEIVLPSFESMIAHLKNLTKGGHIYSIAPNGQKQVPHAVTAIQNKLEDLIVSLHMAIGDPSAAKGL